MVDFKITRNDELMHYRTKGSKNGVRLYQNPDGSLTPLGERHYRDMYGYGEQNSGSSKTLAQLRRERLGQSGRSVTVAPNINKNVKGAPQGKVFRDTSMGPTLLKEFADDPNEVREIGTNHVTYPQIIGKYNSKKADLYEDPRNFQKTPGDKTAPLYKSREDMKEKVRAEYGSEHGDRIPRDQYETYFNTPIKDDEHFKDGTVKRYGTKSLNSINEHNKIRYEAMENAKKEREKEAKEKAEKEKAESLSGRLQSAYNDASKWVVERADDVKKGATDAYNKASKAVVDTADKVKKGAEDAYNTASNAVVDTADKVKKGVSDAYDATSKAVVDAADETRYAAERAYNSAKNAVTDVVDRVKNTYGPGVADAARVISELPKNLNDPHLKEGLDNSYNAVKEWVTTAADDVKKTASEAFDAGKEWVEQAGKDVGDFVNNAVSDVTKAVDDAKNGVVDAANTVGKAAQDGWNWVKGLFGGGDDYGKDEDKDRSNHSSSSHKM